MLGSNYEQTFLQLIQDYPPSILIPRNVHIDLGRRGVDQAEYEDVRMAPRFRCMGYGVIEWLESPRALPIQFPTTQAIIQNISRTGFSILVDRQWYPEQVARVFLPIAIATVRIVRTRRLGIRCYDMGLRVLNYQQCTE